LTIPGSAHRNHDVVHSTRAGAEAWAARRPGIGHQLQVRYVRRVFHPGVTLTNEAYRILPDPAERASQVSPAAPAAAAGGAAGDPARPVPAPGDLVDYHGSLVDEHGCYVVVDPDAVYELRRPDRLVLMPWRDGGMVISDVHPESVTVTSTVPLCPRCSLPLQLHDPAFTGSWAEFTRTRCAAHPAT
jgi:hypothetical protein